MSITLENNKISSAYPIDDQGLVNKGLTKREHFAGLVMQGLASDSDCIGPIPEIAAASVKWADALLAELDK